MTGLAEMVDQRYETGRSSYQGAPGLVKTLEAERASYAYRVDPMGTFLGLLPFLAVVLISFACGYGVREVISRRRRAIEREKYYRRHPEGRP